MGVGHGNHVYIAGVKVFIGVLFGNFVGLVLDNGTYIGRDLGVTSRLVKGDMFTIFKRLDRGVASRDVVFTTRVVGRSFGV